MAQPLTSPRREQLSAETLPWIAEPLDHDAHFEDINIVRPDGLAVAVALVNGNIHAEEAVANANLIAVAPELLKALMKAERMLVAAYGEPSDTAMEGVVAASVIRLARAAIAKAVQS